MVNNAAVVPPSGAWPVGGGGPLANKLWAVTPKATKTSNNIDFLIRVFGLVWFS